MRVKHVTTINEGPQGAPSRWVIALEPHRGRWFEVNVTTDVTHRELQELFMEVQKTVAEKQAAADTEPGPVAIPPLDDDEPA